MNLNSYARRAAALALALSASPAAHSTRGAAARQTPAGGTTAAAATGAAVLVLNKAENTLSIVDPETLTR